MDGPFFLQGEEGKEKNERRNVFGIRLGMIRTFIDLEDASIISIRVSPLVFPSSKMPRTMQYIAKSTV